MATYTMRADGTAGSLAAALDGDPTVVSQCLSLSGHNSYASGASAGDVFQLADNGGPYRGTLYTLLSGTSGSPITYEAYSGDTPIINGANIITGWTVYSGSVYQATVTTQPQQVFIDGTLGDRKTSIGACVAEYDWYWASSVLYLYAPGDPDTEYSEVEAGQRDRCVDTRTYDYIVFDGLAVKYSNRDGFGSSTVTPGDYITIKNCLCEWNWYKGVGPIGEYAGTYTGWLVEDNVARYNGIGGIGANGCNDQMIFRRNECYENAKHQSDEDINSEMVFGWGMKFFGLTGAQSTGRLEVYENLCYDNGRGDNDSNEGQGTGIWFDYFSGTSSYRNVIRHNRVYGNSGNGIFIEISSYADVYGNVVYDNGTTHAATDAGCPAQIVVDSRYDFDAVYNLIYNNTCYGGRMGLKVRCYGTGTHQLSYNEFKNNIFVEQSLRVLYALRGGDNDGLEGDFNVYDNNNFGVEFADFIRWGGFGEDYSAYDSWETAHGEAWAQIEEGPSFTNAAGDDYTLAAGSPCINTGINLLKLWDLGAYIYQGTKDPSHNIALMPESSWPGSVVTGDQDDY